MEPSDLGLLRCIYQWQPLTRRELAVQAGLSPARISALVGQLLSRGVIREELIQDGTPGRPARSLQVNPAAGRLAGLDIGGELSRAVLCDLAGGVLVSLTRATRVIQDQAGILADIISLLDAVCRQGNTAPRELAALGIGLQAIVDARTGIALGWPNTPAWSAAWAGLDVGGELRQRLGVDPVVVDDSARAMGVAAYRLGPARGCPNLTYVHLGNGIGSALLLDGRPYRSTTGLAGELGHVAIREDGPSCSCGNRGCLEVLASTPAVLARVRQRLGEASVTSTLRAAQERGDLSLEVLIKAAHAGDKLAYQVLDEAGSYVGRAVAIALNLTGSELVVLGGPLAQDGGIILDAVQRQVRLRALEHISRQVRIVCDDQGELAGARGAALCALDALFDSPQRLAALSGASRL